MIYHGDVVATPVLENKTDEVSRRVVLWVLTGLSRDMSNFPPPPPFGGAYFHGQPPFPPPPVPPPPSGYGANPQYPYMQTPRQQPYGQGPPGPPPNQFSNTAAFNQNQYNHVAPPPYPPPQVAVPPTPNFYPFQQYQSAATPHQPLQAQAHGMNTPYNHMSAHAPVNTLTPTQPSTPQIYPSGAYHDPRSSQVFQVPGNSHSTANSRPQSNPKAERSGESNDLAPPSEGGSATISKSVEVPMSTTSSENLAQMTIHDPQQTTKLSQPKLDATQRRTQPAVGRTVGQANGDTSKALPTNVRAPNERPPAKLPGLGVSESGPQEKSISASQPAGLVSDLQPDHIASTTRSTWLSRKAQAKKALSSMISSGLTHDQIAREGIDKTILVFLYPEPPKTKNTKNSPPAQNQLATEPSNAVVIERHDSHASSTLQQEHTHHVNNTVSPEPGEVTESDEATHVSRAAANLAPTSSHSLPSPKITIGTVPHKGEERKDYIARLLAAKQAVSKASAASLTMSTGPALTSNVEAKSIDKPDLLEEPLQPPQQSVASNEKKNSQLSKKPEVKDPVQTELVRQRLEALKKKGLNQQVKPTAESQHGLQLELRRNSGEMSLEEQPAHPSRSYSFYADHEQHLFDGLPGLSPLSLAKNGRQDLSVGSPVVAAQQTTGALDIPELPRDPAPSMPEEPNAASASTAQKKRALASDLFDSPPRKRRVDSDGPMQLVIDVSEDEEGEILPEHNREEDTPMLDSELEQHPRTTETGSGLRDKPPLSNFPFSETPIARPPSQAQTPKSLSQLEAQIAAQKERIAAKERNRRLGRPQSTLTATSSHYLGPESGSATPSRVIENQTQIIEEKSQQLKQHQRSLAASKQRLQEKLEAERRTHAEITARAEMERREAVATTSMAERERRLQRKAALEASLPQLDAGIELARKRMEDVRKQQEDLQAEIERDIKGRQALLDELNTLMAMDQHAEPVENTLEQDASDMLRVANEAPGGSVFPPPQEHKAPTVSTPSSADVPNASHQSSNSSGAGEVLLGDEMDISGSSDNGELKKQDNEDEGGDEDSIYGGSDDGGVSARPFPLATTAQAVSSSASREATTPEDYEPSFNDRFSDDDDSVDNDSAEYEPELYPGSPDEAEEQTEESETTPIYGQGSDNDEFGQDHGAAVANTPPSQQANMDRVDADEIGEQYREQAGLNGTDSGDEDGEIVDDVGASNSFEPHEPAQHVDNPRAASLQTAQQQSKSAHPSEEAQNSKADEVPNSDLSHRDEALGDVPDSNQEVSLRTFYHDLTKAN